MSPREESTTAKGFNLGFGLTFGVLTALLVLTMMILLCGGIAIVGGIAYYQAGKEANREALAKLEREDRMKEEAEARREKADADELARKKSAEEAKRRKAEADAEAGKGPDQPLKPGEKPAPPTPGNVVARVKKVAGIDLVSISAGEFYMGSKADDKDAFPVEKPRHKVTISQPFYLGKYKVTVGQFKRFVAVTGHKTDAEKAGDSRTWRNPGLDQTEEHPVVCVSWNDADAFCRWLAMETGDKVRLPREAEWEYGCRAGTTTKFYFGDNEADLGEYAWYIKNSSTRTHPCGLKKPNDFGLYDMHGLTWEWCADGKRTYKDQEETDPEGPTGAGTSRVIRGGSAFYVPRLCRAAHRDAVAPSDRNDHFGFRVFVSR
jgi:formylglycine-generating enzyme required for sulfatase activity